MASTAPHHQYPPHFVWLKYSLFRKIYGISTSQAEELAADAYAEAVVATGGELPSRALLARVADCNAKDFIRQRQRRALSGATTVLSELLLDVGPAARDVLGPQASGQPYTRTVGDYSYAAAHGPEKLVAEKELREMQLPKTLTPSLREVADLMAQGVTDIQDIAAQLDVSEATARQRKSRLLRYVADKAKNSEGRTALLKHRT